MSESRLPQFSTGALLFLLVWSSVLVNAEISTGFSKCLEFFYKETPPQGFHGAQYQPICQRYKNQYRFASLYDRLLRVPGYSAYILDYKAGKRPRNIWMYEPQLVFSRASPEMAPFNSTADQNLKDSQAVLEDYKNSNFTKGHLNPSMHQNTSADREATFTLTNIVPQHKNSNSGAWSRFELEVLGRYRMYCEGPMYVITGALPYESAQKKINNRVSVPEYMWSAYCCPAYKSDLPGFMQKFFPTFASVGRNDPDSGEDIVPVNVKAKARVRGYDVRQMNLTTLETILRQRLNMNNSNLFAADCH